MSIEFYYGAGSPYAWRVWLALEHKKLAYDLKTLSFSAGDTRKPEFVKLNPRHQVPVIVDNGFVLYESAAILEYLDEAYPEPSLFPGDKQNRAVIRRMVREADEYYDEVNVKLLMSVLFTKPEEWNESTIASARDEVIAELGNWERMLTGDYFAGQLSAADFTFYPLLAIALRCEVKKPGLGLKAALPPKTAAWMQRIESLPYFKKTWPAHWK